MTPLLSQTNLIEISAKTPKMNLVGLKEDYLKKLQKRAGESRVYSEHQLIGLEISQLLKDEEHKSLYIKLAKQNNPERLFGIAKELSKNKNVRNKGAYFMAIIKTSDNRHKTSGKK